MSCIFKLQESLDSIQPTVDLKKLSVSPDQPPDPAHCLCFTSDSRHLVTITSSSQLQIITIEAKTFEKEFTFPSISGIVIAFCTEACT